VSSTGARPIPLRGRIALLEEHDPALWERRWRAGHASTAKPYGVDRLEERGLKLLQAPGPTTRLGQKTQDVLDHRAGFPVAGPLRGVANIAQADLTLALLEQYTRLAVILRRHFVPPFRGRPLVTTSCWLGERLVRADAEARRHLVHQYGLVDLVTVWSHNQVEILEDAGFRMGSVRAIPFGVNAEWFTLETGARPIDVLAVGMDAGRDYATLMDAVRGQDVRVLLVCNEANLRGLEVPTNVTIHGPVPHHEYRALLQRAKLVVVPTKSLAYPTGQSVTLEASACGACVVVTDTLPMREYVQQGVTGTLVPEGDPAALLAALTGLLADDERRERLAWAGAERVRSCFTTRVMWDAVAELLVEHGWVRPE
jgi:hypothetical protein